MHRFLKSVHTGKKWLTDIFHNNAQLKVLKNNRKKFVARFFPNKAIQLDIGIAALGIDGAQGMDPGSRRR
jgi:hypothetical protein